MFGRGFRLPFRLLGIPLELDVTFLIVLPLLAWMIGSRIELYVALLGLPIDASQLARGSLPYVLGLLAGVGLFASVVVHELGHAVVGRAYGAKVRKITLWLLGGMALFEGMPRRRYAEAVIAIVGPITSAAIALLLYLALRATPPAAAAPCFVLAYLAVANAGIAVFNLLPAIPLDGGRVLRSVLAARLPPLRATKAAVAVSHALAIVLGFAGFAGGNIFLLFIALFVYMAAGAEERASTLAEAIEGVRVRDIMTRAVVSVEPSMTVTDLTKKMLRERRLSYPVVADGELAGMVTVAQVQGRDPAATVVEVMTADVATIPEDTFALQALERMSGQDFGKLVVRGPDGRIAGVLSKTDLIRTIQLRMAGLHLQDGAAESAS